MVHSIAILLLTVAAGPADAVKAAKDVIASHERLAAAANLDGLMTNVADDVVALIPESPLVRGKPAFREMYKGFFALGRWQFSHDYEGAEVSGDVVTLHGVARGTLTPAGGTAAPFANNFLLLLKKQPDGKFRFWRITFAESAPRPR